MLEPDAAAVPARDRLTKGLSGVAGEYFVAGELSRRGYLASITLRNTRGVDVLVADADAGRAVGVQVKTNQGAERRWLLSRKAETLESVGLFYVFVCLGGAAGVPRYHVVPSGTVAREVREGHAAWLAGMGRGGRVRQDSSVRVFTDADGAWLDRWDVLGLDL